MSVISSITLQGNWGSRDSGGEYKLKCVTSNPIETATAKIWKKQQSQAIKLGKEQIKWVGLEGLSEKKDENFSLVSKTISKSLSTLTPHPK